MDAYKVQRLLRVRKALENELGAMAAAPRVAGAVKRSREGKGRGQHLQAAQGSIRLVEAMDKLLYQAARIKKLPKPRYPGGERV